jgi:GAF domain-containing protein/HAMP domain-containing protein
VDSMQNTTSPSEAQRHAGYTLWISILFSVILAGSGLYVIRTGLNDQLLSIGTTLLFALSAIWLTSRGRLVAGSSMLIATIGVQSILSPLVQSGLHPPTAISALALIGCVGILTLPRKYIGRVLMVGMIIATISVLVDLFGPEGRVQAGSAFVRWGFALTLLALLIFFFSREFFSLNIRTKIVLGILATGGVALGVFGIFAASQTEQVTTILSDRLETSVSLLAEEQLINSVYTQAELANESFSDVREDVESLARNWTSLQNQKQALNQGSYWNAQASLIQLDAGQYGNSPTDISSVYIPANFELDDDLLSDLNTSAYLDFYAPGILESHPSLLAAYAIDTRGVTRYYPNINLASVLPPDFDATQRPYFEITSPLFNPQRLARWTIPYVDATGGGLVVTVASPVYLGNNFKGVVAVDMKIGDVTSQVQELKIGQTGYAFLIDDAGRVLSMPPAGYELFGLDPNDINDDEFFKQTILGAGSDELQAAVRRMVAGGSGLLIVNAAGVDTYVSFAPIRANGYSLALVVPVSELQGAINTARNETQAQIQSGIRVLAIILIALLAVAIMISLAIGEVISAPVIRLTGVANQIVGGDLSAQATIGSRDEIGTLSQAFNTMTSRLRQLLQDLENRVEERTAQLARANEKNERRAKQFESISQVTATISSTRDLDALLSQITTAISTKFGFYHAGIFLLDPRKEYAVLSAANSEGGQKMLARNHRLRVGETGIVGYVTSTGTPRVALNTGQDAVFFNNPDLPDTHSEIALPLKAGDEVIGALDVQSTEENAFGQEDVNILTALADQVSIAIQNARQYQETRKALAESVASSRQFVQTGWQQFTRSEKLTGIHHTGAKATLLYTQKDNGKDEGSLKQDQARAKNRGASLSLPVKLRGQVIGTVDVHSVDSRRWDQDELDVVAAIIERAAIAMENARLLAESQKRAAKERTIGEISAKISAQSDIDQLLKTAAQELNRTLPGAEIAIQFNGSQETE